jgi:large subunit ribosomal protein L24e
MVVHRTCSFCAGDIEPGTGQLFVKRDGSIFSFCSSSCRKQQLDLGRVGHRLRWTHAHELKRLAEQRRQPSATGPSSAASAPKAGKAPTDAKAAEPKGATAPAPAARTKPAKAKPAESDAEAAPAAEPTPAKKSHPKKAPPASGSA